MKARLKRWIFRLLRKDPDAVVVTFCTGDPDLCRRMAEEVRGLVPDFRHFVVTPANWPELRRELQLRELEAARAAGVDALVAVYHSDHRELCAHERDWPFRIVNVLEVVGASMGISEADNFKRLKIMQDADAIVNDCADLIGQHGIDAATARAVVAEAMLGEQPVPLGRPKPA